MSDVGTLIRCWRNARGLSQLALAGESVVSLRHLSFIETGRSSPSRAMVLKLAEVLDVPLRERNSMLLAAGFALVYRESALNVPELAAIRDALDAIMAQQEPYPALVMDRDWNIRYTNAAAGRFFGFLRAGHDTSAPGPPNVLRRMFHPDGVRRYAPGTAHRVFLPGERRDPRPRAHVGGRIAGRGRVGVRAAGR
jgi:transcriptional regulator with XRE-family HTH domain